jgi:two-component system response regulator FlrC
VRELENTVERAVLLSGGRRMELADVQGAGMGIPPVPTLKLAGMTVAEMERRLILDTLCETKNNRTRAAQLLGISIRTLRNKLAEYRAAGWVRPGEYVPLAGGAAPSDAGASAGERAVI